MLKFLEEKSQSDVVPKTVVDFRELLLGSGYPGRDQPASAVYLMDDDVDLFVEYGKDFGFPIVGTDGVKTNFLLYTWQPRQAEQNGLGDRIGDIATSSSYYALYERIKGCNAVLDYVDDAIGTQQEKDRVKGGSTCPPCVSLLHPGQPLRRSFTPEPARAGRAAENELYCRR